MSPPPPSFYEEFKQSVKDNSIANFLKELPKSVINGIIRDLTTGLPCLLVMRCNQYLYGHG